ncbi:MAG: L,D-transpeptidase [Candidatus Sericytochromatia bacterium]
MSEIPVYPPLKTRRLPVWRLAVLVGVGTAALAGTVILSPAAFKAFSRDIPSLQLVDPLPAQLNVQNPTKGVEGQPVPLMLGWRDLPHGAKVEPVELTLRWKDTSYLGKPLQIARKLSLGQTHQRQELIFQSPGSHLVEILGPDQSVWKSLNITTDPFPATVFPAHWELNRELKLDPSHYHMFVNLQYDPKAPDQQRQYMQFTEDGRILERLLISSGAVMGTTPLGDFSLGFKDYYPRSAKYNNTPMPFWSAITVPGHIGEVGFHSLEDGGYIWLLGRPASHGCIRMSRQPSVETDPKTGAKFWGDRGGARWVYDRVPKLTPVTIFRRKLPAFEFEDYARWEARQYREAIQAAKAAKSQKAAKAGKTGAAHQG